MDFDLVMHCSMIFCAAKVLSAKLLSIKSDLTNSNNNFFLKKKTIQLQSCNS